MERNHFISVVLDKRRILANGKYPVRLRVFTHRPRKQKLYPTMFELKEHEFEGVWISKNPKKAEHISIRGNLHSMLRKAEKIADELEFFTFPKFEKKMFKNAHVQLSVQNYFEDIVEEMENRNRLGTASSYSLSMKSLKDFVENKQKFNFEDLTFYDITDSWLMDYEKYMVNEKKRSVTTVGVYLRALRVLFNLAIDKGEITRDKYPFGKRRFQIPASKNVKKALTKEQLKTLFESIPKTNEQIKAKAFWFFSYACNGMNIKDIVLLRHKDIDADRIVFIRAKTQTTSKTNLKPITVYLNEFSLNVINCYGQPKKKADDFVFGIVDDTMTEQEKRVNIQNFTRFINQHMDRLCKDLELPKVSTYWARHSFATNAIRSGATMEFIQESLGHKDLATTQNYFAGFDSDTKKQFAKTIMNFD
jgi:site-specific recombinase XerD